jgi:hypothetical protein
VIRRRLYIAARRIAGHMDRCSPLGLLMYVTALVGTVAISALIDWSRS